ncbi:hypothetical protein HDV00_009406 [Rhizophlyctis rosea]|nr:hypothetical protein HDV00_009406 [Rhizophlyctis rosea]
MKTNASFLSDSQTGTATSVELQKTAEVATKPPASLTQSATAVDSPRPPIAGNFFRTTFKLAPPYTNVEEPYRSALLKVAAGVGSEDDIKLLQSIGAFDDE